MAVNPSSASKKKSARRAVDANEPAPFAARVPKPLKRQAGRTVAHEVPSNIRVFAVELDRDERARIRQRLGVKLGKYSTSIERVTVRVKDVNGPRGGVDHTCSIKVVLSGLPSVIFESQDASRQAAIYRAINGSERAVRRTLQRRRMQPVRAIRRLITRQACVHDPRRHKEGVLMVALKRPQVLVAVSARLRACDHR